MPAKSGSINIGPSLSGRLGTALGKGVNQFLTTQIPQEVERQRGIQGLSEIENNPNLSQFEKVGKLHYLPGSSPQLVQSGTELLKQQAMRQALANRVKGNEQSSSINEGRQNIKNVPFGGNRFQGKQSTISQPFMSPEQAAKSSNGIVQENPLSDKYLPPIPWTQNKRDNELLKVATQDPNLTFEQANAEVDKREQREMALPLAEQKRREFTQTIQDKADEEFQNQLELVTQKEGSDVFKDITGETQLNLKKAMYNDLATDPDLTEKTAAEKWVRKALDLAKTKSQLNTLSKRDLYDHLAPGKKDETLKQLKSISKIFAETGNNEELFNSLRSDFNLSPGRSAGIAYRISEPVNNIIKNTKPLPLQIGKSMVDFPKKSATHSRKLAEEISKNMNFNDSVLAIASQLKDRMANFDESAFIDYFRENQDKMNPIVKRELGIGVSDMTPSWGDLAVFPYFNAIKNR